MIRDSINLLRKLLGYDPLPPIQKESAKEIILEKDPKENIWTKGNSTMWKTVGTSCPNCGSDTSHDEFMADICNNCGFPHTQSRFGKMWRKIFYQGKWQYQIRWKYRYSGDYDKSKKPLEIISETYV